MERVKNILQKLQEVYYGKHQKTAIDIDLMLDYTRVMYADLLEWRGSVKDDTPAVPVQDQPSAAAQSASGEEEPGQSGAGMVPVKEASGTQEEGEAAATEEPAEAAPETVAEDPPGYHPVVRDEAPPKPEPVPEGPAVVAPEPEKEYIDMLQQERSGISFEPPSAPEHLSEIEEDLTLEEATESPVPEALPAPPPAAIPLPDMTAIASKPLPAKDLFSTVKIPKDIRNAIGINDKYLFLNELFNNHKSNYEEALDKLNRCSSAEEAMAWIRSEVAPAQKWDKEDTTVNSFYDMVRAHFS